MEVELDNTGEGSLLIDLVTAAPLLSDNSGSLDCEGADFSESKVQVENLGAGNLLVV